MNIRYSCRNEQRRNLVAEPKDADGNLLPPKLNGIDYLEIGSADQKTINLYFIHPLPGEPNQVPSLPTPALTKDNFQITGGERIKNIKIDNIKSVAGNLIKIEVNQAGDFSTYTLGIITSPGNTESPPGFDPQLSSIDFSFKVTCPYDFDCKKEIICPPEKFIEPEIDYLAKDYNSFRQLMLDRLSVLVPDWKERNPADLQIALVELLAYIGDHLSYYQDAIATEAYPGTAHKRISLRRHARLLDYRISEGYNSRVFVHVNIIKGGDADSKMLPERTPLLTGNDDDITVIDNLDQILNEDPSVFETMHNIILNSAHNEISFYTWGDSECCLPAGSISATLENKNSEIKIKAGDVLIFVEKASPITGIESDADLNHRHPVRLKEVIYKTDPLTDIPIIEIEWYNEDALPFPLCISAKVESQGSVTQVIDISSALGNIVLADYGRTVKNSLLIPNEFSEELTIKPKLADTNITFNEFYDESKFKIQGAVKALKQNQNNVLPFVKLYYENEVWTPKPDLLGSDRFATEFVCEVENDASVYLRFGDDILGKRPAKGTVFIPEYRVGNGSKGNVGTESIKKIFSDFKDIKKIRNPLPAVGGKDPESNELIKQMAPQAFRVQQRAVTEHDYAEVTQRNEEIQKAAANFRWTGSWNTVFITVDRKSGFDFDEEFRNEINDYVNQFRMAGYDLEINKPVFVSLEIELDVCVKAGYFRSNIKESLLRKFSSGLLTDGSKGFFHPDNFTFGQPVYLSRIYQTAMEVDGIDSLVVTKFQRFGKKENKEIENGILQPAQLEILRLDNNPNFPENGKINFVMHGGL